MDETPCLVPEKGGWRTLPYIIGAISGFWIASTGVSANLLVFLIKHFSITNVHAAQIVNVFGGCSLIAPTVGAIAGDALGCFAVSSISNAICVLSMLLFMLSAMLPSLISPAECSLGVLCESPTNTQFAVLYIAIGLYIIGRGGNSGNITTFGAIVLYIPCESSIDQRSATEEETEALGTIIRLLPLMSTTIPSAMAIGMKGSLVTIQAMAMDRHLGPNFLIPAASISIFSMVATALSILLLDRFVYPRWNLRPLQRIGTGHLVTFLYLVGMAVLESSRLASLNNPNRGDMSVLWLAAPMLLEGLADALFLPAQLSFFFQQFPESLRSSSGGASTLMSGIGSYMSTAAITLVARYTKWMRDDTDQSRLDNVYWMLAVIVLLNFGYFLLCAVLYKSRGTGKL